MPRHIPTTQVSASLPASLHRTLRVRLAIDGESFQGWLQRQVRRYVETAETPAPAPRRAIKRTASREGDAA